MNVIDITEEHIERLEKVGLAIIDSISEEYETLKESDADKTKSMKRILNEVSGILNKEGIHNGK